MPLVERDVVSALANAFATDGALISVAPGTRVDKPLHLIFITADGAPALHSWQSAIRLGEEAELQIIETHAGPHAAQIFSAMRLEIGAGAALRHLRLGACVSTRHLSTVVANLAAGASYDPLHFMPGGALTRAQNFITFNGVGGRCHFNGAMLLRGREHGDMTLVVDHVAPDCESREVVKAVLDGDAHGVFQAKVIVRPGAQKTDGRQLAHGLLLSNTAEFDAKPELEIYADDVKCNHGATSGALDEDMLFYLRSRGIPVEEAKSLLILAFVAEVFDHIDDEHLREVLTAHASRWLSA
jgi:Fe-S cluster assembly protein SufD